MADNEDPTLGYWSGADLKSAQSDGMDIRDNPQNSMPPLAGLGQMPQPNDQDRLFSALQGFRSAVQGAQQGAGLGDPFTAALSGLAGAAAAPNPQMIAAQRAQMQMQMMGSLPVDQIAPNLVAAHPELKGMPLAVVERIAPILERTQAMADQHYTLDQAANLMAPDSSPESVAKTKAQLAQLYPHGIVPKDFAHIAATNNRLAMTTGVRQDQFDQKQLQEFNRDTNPDIAGNRKLVGMAANLNKRIQSGLTMLQGNPTNQQLNGAVADLATMLTNGAADDAAIKAQSYNTIQGKLNDIKTLITSSPTKNAPPAVVAAVRQSLQELGQINDSVIARNFESNKAIYGDTLARNPDKLSAFQKAISKSMINPSALTGAAAPRPKYSRTMTNPQTGVRIGFNPETNQWEPFNG